MAKELKTNAVRYLDRQKIPYTVQTYDCPEFIDGVAVAHQLGIPLEQTFKTLVTHGKSGQYYVFVLPVAEELDLKKAAQTVGEKSVVMLPVKEITNVTGYIRGGCSPLGMKKQFVTVLDDSALRLTDIYISGGRRGTQIQLSPDGLIKACGCTTAHITADNM